MEQDDGETVFLYVYDLTQGIARQISTAFLRAPIDAVWHTGIGLYGREYFFGPCVHDVPIGSSLFGTPKEVLELGTTHVPKEVFEEYLQGITSRYSMFTYSLLNRNCNSFTDEAAKFLVGQGIPAHIRKQADTSFDAFPMGTAVLPMLQDIENTLRFGIYGSPTGNNSASSSPWPSPSAPGGPSSKSSMNGNSSSSSFPAPAAPRTATVVPSVSPAAPWQPAPPRGSDPRRRYQDSS